MTDILIIAYYWPPSGGAGVQRWVKLTKYLHQHGIKPHVLTVHEDYASYMQIDEGLNHDVADHVLVYKTKSFEPLNIYAKIAGKKNVPTAGFSNTNTRSLSHKLISAVRSHFFIPDPRKGWNKYAFRKAEEIIEKENIQVVITTSPPHSTQLIGLKLKRRLGIRWIADFRDPWTDIYYYKLLGHSFLSKKIDEFLERKVLKAADQIVTVSDGFKAIFSKKGAILADKIQVIPNGFDPQDFKHLEKTPNDVFTLCYTGTVSDQYNLSPFLAAIASLQSGQKSHSMRFQIVGSISRTIQEEIKDRNIDLEFISTVPHGEINQYQKNADALLLIVPDVEEAKGIVPGKLFEYLATGNPILCLGPKDCDAGKIIERCGMGKVIERENQEGITNFLTNQIDRILSGKPHQVDTTTITSYARENQAKEMAEVIKSVRTDLNHIDC